MTSRYSARPRSVATKAVTPGLFKTSLRGWQAQWKAQRAGQETAPVGDDQRHVRGQQA